MLDVAIQNAVTVPQPLPQTGVTVRPGVMSDIPFIDGLQKLHTKQVGWMPTATFEGKIRLGHVLIAEEGSGARVQGSGEDQSVASFLNPEPRPLTPSPLGYLIAQDQYFKRDDVGVIYQMNVVPGRQRSFVGATLLKAQFEKSAYGCKLYCCWCAQDIAANRFWEAMGFVPLAFRTGSEKKARTHIFWQKRIRAGDETTPWWFPSKTAGGSIREDRIVLPIPPGTHWSDAKPMILPEAPKALIGESVDPLIGGGSKRRAATDQRVNRSTDQRRAQKSAEAATPVVRRNGLSFDIPRPGEVLPETVATVEKAKKEKPPKAKRVCDPRLVSAARELRDRWLERINTVPLLPSAKYDVTRSIDAVSPVAMKLLDAA